MSETTEQRARRERQRLLFDSVAEVYDETRQGYPEPVVRWIIETSRLGPGAAVLEVGCGTGQLTAALARQPFHVTAIDLGSTMIQVARRNVPDGVRFVVSSFEEFASPDASFDLIASATAAHWIEPEILCGRSARLLSPGGWLAIASVGEDYDEPLASALREAWMRHSSDRRAWVRKPPPAAARSIVASGLFDPPLEKTDARRADLRPERVLNLERTRATYLDYDGATRDSFDADLRRALSGLGRVPTTIRTQVTMARVRTDAPDR